MLEFLAKSYEGIVLVAFLVLLFSVLLLFSGEPRLRRGSPLFCVLVALSIATVVVLCAALYIGLSEEGRWAVLDANASVVGYVDFVRDFPDSAHRADAEARICEGQANVVRSLAAVGEDRAATVLYRGLKSEGPLPTLKIKIVGDREFLVGINADRKLYEEALNGFEDSAVAAVRQAAALFAPEIQEVRVKAGLWAGFAPYEVVTVVLSYEVMQGASYRQGYQYTFSSIGMEASWAIYFPGEAEPQLAGTIPSSWPPARPHWEGAKYPEMVIADIVTAGIMTGLWRAFAEQPPVGRKDP